MALLQIREPDNPSTSGIALGIDLGTTNSLAAFTQRDGSIKLVEDTNGLRIIPSVVAIDDDGNICVGSNATTHIGEHGWQVFSSIKRYMGLSAEEITNCRYTLDTSTTPPHFVTAKKNFTAQEISAEILKHLIHASGFSAQQIDTLVVTVPAYFSDAQRKATQDSARLTGLPLKRLLNEPTAAALAYDLEKKGDSHIAVFDLGGGTFDISILQCSEKLLKVLVTAGDSYLGGDDFDERLLELALHKMRDKYTDKQDVLKTHTQHQQLLQIARQVKQTLSTNSQAVFDLDCIAPGTHLSISVEEFTQATSDLVARCRDLTLAAIRDAGLTKNQIDNLVLVGGSTRMPQIKQRLGEVLPDVAIYDALDPDTTVAIGAAHHAATLAGQHSDHKTLVDVVPLSLGIETMGGLMEKIISRNTPIPVTCEQQFTTARDGQQQFLLHVLQGERELVSDCRSLARFLLKGIPKMPAGAAKLKVRFAIDASGMLSVTAMEELSGVKQEVVIESKTGLDEETITKLLKDSYAHAKEDMQARTWRETLFTAEQLTSATSKALQLDGDLLSEEEKKQITLRLSQAVAAQQSNNSDVLHQANQELIDATTAFAHRRMGRTLQKSLTNRTLNEFSNDNS